MARFEYRRAIRRGPSGCAPGHVRARTSHDGRTALGQAGIAIGHREALRERAPMGREAGLRFRARGAVEHPGPQQLRDGPVHPLATRGCDRRGRCSTVNGIAVDQADIPFRNRIQQRIGRVADA